MKSGRGQTDVAQGGGVDGHPLADDARAARTFLETIRLPGARAELRYGPTLLPLGERGTGIVLGLLDHDGSRLDEAERILTRRRWGSKRSQNCVLTSNTRGAGDFVKAASLLGRTLSVRFGAQNLVLNSRGAALVLALLQTTPRRVHRAAVVLGAERRHGWAEGMIEAGPIKNDGTAIANACRAAFSRRVRRGASIPRN